MTRKRSAPSFQDHSLFPRQNEEQRDGDEFARLFQEFVRSYPETNDGQEHIRMYESGREQGRRNFEEILAAADRGRDVTEQVLLRLLPYTDSTRNREAGAWVHIAPVFATHIRRKFEPAGWAKAEDWPHIARAILHFVRHCVDAPDELQIACEEFSHSPYSTGLQTGTLTPILNALRPDDFMLINNKSRKTINHFVGTSFGQKLIDYPAANARGRELVQWLSPIMHDFGVPQLRDSDLFDMFSHWLMAIKGSDSGRKIRYWKIAPGANAWYWDECRAGQFVAMGYNEVGDLEGLTREEYEWRRDEVVRRHKDEPGYAKRGVDQVWRFHNIQPGNRVVANRGKQEVLAIGTVVGPYYFVGDQDLGHRLPVKWDDQTSRQVDEYGWQSTLIELDVAKFESIRSAPPAYQGEWLDSIAEDEDEYNTDEPGTDGYFSETTFQLLADLHARPHKETYLAHKDLFKANLEEPFKQLFHDVAGQLPPEIVDVMETEKRVLSRILKNDYGQGGAWDYYWGAFYPKGGKRTEDAQLSMWINYERFEVGFYIGRYGNARRNRFVRNCTEYGQSLAQLLGDDLSDRQIVFGGHEDIEIAPDGAVSNRLGLSWQDLLRAPEQADFDVSVIYPRDRLLRFDATELASEIAQFFARLFPLVLVAISDDPVSDIVEYLGLEDSGEEELEPNPEYTLSQCASETGIGEEELARWIRAIERKRQAILYGPPGTGKTFVAERLARHLIGGGDGFCELVQFHPAYAYEDFIQGIRPKRLEGGGLDYPTVPGRFLEFCREAKRHEGTSVLIIDEINRANLARVFGELMYLLEYRDREVPLAAGNSLRIPNKVRIIGTMNTADRSIALVDHALRRRFAFLALYPNYDILQRYHRDTGFHVQPLIDVLRRLNRQIGDRHYEVGITFFLRRDLSEQIEDIWRMEIEPYLEEYFFDQPDQVETFRWAKVGQEMVERS